MRAVVRTGFDYRCAVQMVRANGICNQASFSCKAVEVLLVQLRYLNAYGS